MIGELELGHRPNKDRRKIEKSFVFILRLLLGHLC